jgi:hypothetical protein
MKWLKRLRALFFGRDLAQVAFDHWVPPHNSVQSWQAGPRRCFYCLMHDADDAFDRPCTRRRPDMRELA